jgi:hypothetical protein
MVGFGSTRLWLVVAIAITAILWIDVAIPQIDILPLFILGVGCYRLATVGADSLACTLILVGNHLAAACLICAIFFDPNSSWTNPPGPPSASVLLAHFAPVVAWRGVLPGVTALSLSLWGMLRPRPDAGWSGVVLFPCVVTVCANISLLMLYLHFVVREGFPR